MSRMHLTPLTMLLVASVAALAGAQAPAAPATPADSVVPDSLKPKKTGRFGGLMNKAKAVAGNKTVQAAAKAAGTDAVKGAAIGVACTVVPGAAVASAVTGQGPCANSGIMGMLSGQGVGGTAAAMATGAASTAAAGAAAKAMGQGGIAGAAARGAMGAIGGGGLSNAAATAAAMKMIKGGGGSGVSDAATAAAAMKMMQMNGLSNAAAAAAMKDAGMSGANMAAAMKMMQGNGAEMAAAMKIMQGMAGSGGPAAMAGAATPVAAPAAPVAVLWTNYDFVPGERVIYYADFTEDKVGNFPTRLQFVEGNMEVAELGGRRTLRATSQSKLTIPLPEVLPQRFTIEIDVINRPSLDGAGFHLRGSVGRIDDAGTSVIGWGSDGVALRGGGGGEVKLTNNEPSRLRYRGKPAQLRILGDGKYVKVYLDEKRLANVPNANFERSKVLHLVIDARSDENPAYVGRIRVAESRKSIYDDLMAAGHTATQGLLFDTGSDRLRPESTPTLKLIAAMLEQHPELKLRIEGHTDNVGAKDANRTLSDKRAAAVKTALVKEYRVNAGRLESKGFGDSKPVGGNDTAEGRSNNRRVELVKI
ncbi:MAG TPA: OmpA family protein [Gemmatimonadaceae bacterium]|nr:OmpA family protein [Gemmatimonadaceae bacterium]